MEILTLAGDNAGIAFQEPGSGFINNIYADKKGLLNQSLDRL